MPTHTIRVPYRIGEDGCIYYVRGTYESNSSCTVEITITTSTGEELSEKSVDDYEPSIPKFRID